MPNIEGISVQKSNAERKSYVVVGAILSCSSGSQLNRLKMPFSHGVFVKGKPQMNIMDFVPNVNIMPFGKCSSLKNPTVASATAANNGVLTPMPCTPVMTMPWMDGKTDKVFGGHPALLNKSTNMCFHCGLIKIEDDGQDLGGVTIGNQSSANSGPSDVGFGQGPACEKPQEKPTMWDNFVKGISKLGDVPAAMQKAANELPGALEKAANDLPKGLQKAAEDLPKGVNLFVQESYVKPIQEDWNTLRDDQLNLADADAAGGIVLAALTAGRNKDIEDIWSGLASVNKRKSKGKESNPNRTQEETEDLARDPAQGNQITEKGMIEREIGLDLETRGILSGIKRDPSGAAEFIDANGTKWDIKGFNSHFPPKKGGFRLDKVIGQIEKEFSKGENVIVDTTKMSSQHIDELRKAIQEKNMSSRILWWP